MKTGLCSITFREVTPEAIIREVTAAGLDGIEWGGDVHVPHGDLAVARDVGRRTREAGLTVTSYGSYYEAGSGKPPSFETVLDTALELGAPVVRIWAAHDGESADREGALAVVAADARRAAELAARHGVRVAFEFHGGTLTDSGEGARMLLERAGHPGVRCYWQPATDGTPLSRLDDLRQVLPWLENVHVFHWVQPRNTRRPLEEGAPEWSVYLRELGDRDGYLLLEYVKDDSLAAFAGDARTLRGWVGG